MTNGRGWKKGDTVVSDSGAYLYGARVKYLADSELDYDCFIGEDENGDVSDDWVIDEFELERE